jgi:mono/diheme cytochrome c family protein
VRRVVRLFPVALAVYLAGCSLAEDVTPPPGLLAGQPVRPAFVGEPTAIALPAEAADPSAGAAIYAERCAPCHGARGLGDGEQSAGLPVPPAALADPGVARAASLSDWYQMVTVGNIDRFMPPFQSLTDAQRLDVAAYALTLSASPEEVALGRAAYDANECESCHASGGNGPARALTVSSLAERSGTELFDVITDGGAGGEMPAFGDRLSADERWALVAFIRSLGVRGGEPAIAPSPAPSEAAATPAAAEGAQPTPEGIPATEAAPSVVATPPPIVEVVAGTVRGQVVNGTTGELAPEGLQITLLGMEGADDVYSATTQVDDAGHFVFEELEIVPGRLLSVSADYQGVTYVSELAHLVEESPVLEFPLTVFEATADTSSLSVAQLHLILSSPQEGFVRGVEVWVFSNSGDRAVRPGDGDALLEVTLPEGAVAVQMTGGAFIGASSDPSRGMLFSLGVPPGVGSAQLALVFDAPFDGGLEIEQPVEVPIESVILLSEAGGLRPRGSAWESLGVADFGGVTVEQFVAEALPAGEVLEVSLVPAQAGGAMREDLPGIGIGVAVLGAALIVAGLWWYRRRGLAGEGAAPVKATAGPAAETMDRETLLRAMAALDDEFEAGRIEAEEYRARRYALKQRVLDRDRGIHD